VPSRKTRFRTVRLSLQNLLGKEYTEAVCTARALLAGEDGKALRQLCAEKVDFLPKTFQQQLVALLPQVGESVCPGLAESASGATSDAFAANTKTALSPLSGYGYLRIGENGTLCLSSKSAHYHAPLGHGFPGYRVVSLARQLAVPNATHNNTRGHITRLLEEELVRAANGVARGDSAGMERLLRAKRQTAANRVLNLETGSLAAEAAVKLLLGRFYRAQAGSPTPKYEGKTPVFVVIGDEEGGLEANYHGTTVLTQIMRGMWPSLAKALEKQGAFLVRPVRPNNIEDLERVFARYEKGRYKIAGFFYELVMMNYAARRLDERYVKRVHALCSKHDVPTVVDEIQTCVWSPELFLFREYGVKPSCIVLGKGFPGGEFAASRILFSAALDCLPQFGALVTNGQEELASLAYLITMRWAEANGEVTGAVGDYYMERLLELAGEYPSLISVIEGKRHLAGVYFDDLDKALDFAKRLNSRGLDISVQTYKKGCPPCALTKLPLIAGYEAVDLVIERMDQALSCL